MKRTSRFGRGLAIALLGVALGRSTFSHAYVGKIRGPDDVREFVFERLKEQDLARLAETADEFRKTKARFDDGRWKLMLFYRAFEEIGQLASDSDVAGFRSELEGWMPAFPDSPTPVVAAAELIAGQAWKARGKKPALDTPGSAMDEFHQRLSEASALLEAHRAAGSHCPGWYTARLETASLLGADAAKRSQLFNEGVAFEPAYQMLYLTYATHLTPRWGGSFEAIQNFASRAAELSKATEGTSMYARVYWVALAVERDAVFTSGGIDWPKLRESFLDLEHRFPGSVRNANAFVKFACGMRDKETAARLVGKIGGAWEKDIWWRAENYEQCRTWAGSS